MRETSQDPKDSSCLSTENKYHQTNIYAIAAAQKGEVNMPLGKKQTKPTQLSYAMEKFHSFCSINVSFVANLSEKLK